MDTDAGARRLLYLSRPIIFVIFILGIFLSYGTFVGISNYEKDKARDKFMEDALYRSLRIKGAFDESVNAVEATGAFFESSDEVTRREFTNLHETPHLVRWRSVTAHPAD